MQKKGFERPGICFRKERGSMPFYDPQYKKSGIDAEAGKVSVREAFPFLGEKKHIISLAGAGGKTTLMYALAWECQKSGYRTLVTTTTHIMRPARAIRAYSREDLQRLWESGSIAAAGEDAPDGKLRALRPEILEEYCALADMVFIEADGAKRMPCKVPKESEPVILPQSDIVIGVMGLDAIGRPLEEVCFRQEEAVKLLKVPKEHILTEKDAALILSSENGTAKQVGERTYYAVLNKCDGAGCMCSGMRIAELLNGKRVDRAVLSFFPEAYRTEDGINGQRKEQEADGRADAF